MSDTPVTGELRGAVVTRHHGDPAAEWRAATTGAAVRDRSHRRRWWVQGRQPAGMLQGIVTGRIPAPWPLEAGGGAGRAEYSVVLTPKGRTISDLRLWRIGGEEGESAGFVLDVPAAGAEPLGDHLRRLLPPRLARVEDRSEATAMQTVIGPGAARVLAGALEGGMSEVELEEMQEGDLRGVECDEGLLLCIRSGELSEPAWDLVGERAVVDRVRTALDAGGVRPVGSGVWEALRLEAGRPAFGADLTDQIPTEAGVDGRAIDQEKGCYTGQEVIVRIRDRGHVNRHLRRVRLGEGPLPAVGTELWREDGDKVVGHLTSVGTSPRQGALALGYVRREVEPPGWVRLGGADGRRVAVEAID